MSTESAGEPLKRVNSNGRFGYSQLQRGFDLSQLTEYKTQAQNFGLSGDAFVVLKEKLDVKLRIEAMLSDLFERRIRLVEEGGYLNPKLQKDDGSKEYELKEEECHGLKELITLLTFLYDDEHNCLIIDEPELHLHPQYQTFLLREIRRLAGNPFKESDKKCFFLITHSPYFVDIRTPEELCHCVIFQPDRCPKYVDELDNHDAQLVASLLPRLNTHHKQFFFATRPIFVEGYRDQQIFSMIQEKRGKLMGASGASIIDVGGKDELDFFFRLCRQLGIEGQFIVDFDALFEGRLRRSIRKDERSKRYVQCGALGADTSKVIGKAEKEIKECLQALAEQTSEMESAESNLAQLREALEAEDNLAKKRYFFCLGLQNLEGQIHALLSDEEGSLNLIESRIRETKTAFAESGVHLLPNGELENHLPSYQGNPYQISRESKLDAFRSEQRFLTKPGFSKEKVESRYPELIKILDRASRSVSPDIDAHLEYVLGDWIHKVQMEFRRGKITNQESLKRRSSVEWKTHQRIVELVDFSANGNSFRCRIRLKPLIDSQERLIAFDSSTTAATFSLNDNTVLE